MVGFPGEGEEEFQELLDFISTVKFDRMGAFAYSEEDDTWAANNLEDNIPEEIKQARLDKLMDLQASISEELNNLEIGKTVRLLVEDIEGDTRVCRSQWDSPEVDMNYYVSGSHDMPGEFIDAEITSALPFDFEAVKVKL